MKKGNKCSHCNAPLEKGANYCHHCGKRTRGLHGTAHFCQHCKRLIEQGATYCKHCGESLTKKKRTFASYMVHVLVFLIILLGLFLLYTYPRPGEKQIIETKEEPTLRLSNLQCNEEAIGFEVCGDVTWSGGAYAKAHIPGGEELEQAQQHTEPFMYCQPVGNTDGFRVFRAFVYNELGEVINERGEGVSCVKKVADVQQKKQGTYSFKKKVQFYTESMFNRPESMGNLIVNFPDKVISCKINGKFVTDEGGQKTGTVSKKVLQYCHNAFGNITGYISSLKQSVTVDAGPFRWDRVILSDPEPNAYDNYIAYARTCDAQYSNVDRYHTYAQASGIGTSNLALNWYYKNDDTKPRVYFDLEFDCLLQK